MNLSLCCISIILQEQGYKFQTMTYTRFKSLDRTQALTILSSRILNNFIVTDKIIQHCHLMGLKGYRLSSNIIPILNHPDVNLKLTDLPDHDKIFIAIDCIKKTIKNTGIRVSAHPSEYITLTSDNPSAIANSIRDLEQHAEIFDLLELTETHWNPLNIHVRQDGNPDELLIKFASNFNKLSDSVKQRLVLEVNDNVDGTWHIPNLIKYFYDNLGIPITFDNLHYKFCHGNISEEDAFNAAYNTWKYIPIFHFSEGINNTRKHADFATTTPNNFGKDVYWDVELKSKDLAIKQILNKTKL
jgi:UV DNA damage endonuclease